MHLNRTAVSCTFLLAILLPSVSLAQRHPRYLRARTDLRISQRFMRLRDDPAVERYLHRSDEEVEGAIREIDRAAVLDGRDVRDNPPADVNVDRLGKFRKIRTLLQSARADLGGETDTPAAARWRSIAFRRIDAALDLLRRAAFEAHLDRGW
jgi:hypothetical protein